MTWRPAAPGILLVALPTDRHDPGQVTEHMTSTRTRDDRTAQYATSLAEARAVLDQALAGQARADIIATALDGASFAQALARIRAGMVAHAFPTGGRTVSLRRVVTELDRRTRAEGFQVLQGWDPIAHRFADDAIPVLMLDYCARNGISAHTQEEALGVLLDYYFLAVLSLITVRAWDDGDAGDTLDAVTRMLRALQGPRGSGRRFVDDAETLLLLAISHYHPEESAYDVLVRKVWSLGEPHRLRVACAGAAILGSHLRWGFQCMYRRDVGVMREDNIVDYPWLLFSMVTLMREYDRLHTAGETGACRDLVVDRLLNGLTPDPWAFSGKAPRALVPHQAEHDAFREIFAGHREQLLSEFRSHEPTTKSYSPIAFQFNFLPNTVTALVSTTLGDGAPNLPLNALLTRGSAPVDAEESSPEALARRLMQFSAAMPDRLGSRGSRLVLYDPHDGLRSFNAALRASA
jgi:hypothetical protein